VDADTDAEKLPSDEIELELNEVLILPAGRVLICCDSLQGRFINYIRYSLSD